MSKKKENTPPADFSQFRLQKVFVKDLSFSNPSAPEVFLQKQKPYVDVKIGRSDRQLPDDHSFVTISANVTVKDGRDGETIYSIAAELSGVFLVKNLPAKDLPLILEVECPNILFPYLRQAVSQVSTDGGFTPFLLEPFNFMTLYQQEKRNKPSSN